MIALIHCCLFSPNTPGLRQWQKKEQLEELLGALLLARNSLNILQKPPILLKLAPDLTDSERKDIAEVIQKKEVRLERRRQCKKKPYRTE